MHNRPAVTTLTVHVQPGLKVTCHTTMSLVDSLARLCQNYIVEHLEEFPVSHLSLLPLSRRRELLWRLPIADVCLRLENTEFVEGLDMATYWKLPYERCDAASEFPKDSDIERYIKERWPNEVDYAKARLYGEVAMCQIGGVPDYHEFVLPQNGDLCDEDVILFLYGVREIHTHGCNCLTIPPRYDQMRDLPNNEHLKDVFDAIVQCFKGELPNMLPQIQLYKDSDIYCHIDLSDVELSFLSEVEYIGIQCRPFEARGVAYIKKLVNKATHLQVLVLQGLMNNPLYLDDFCIQLATCQQFWSKFRLLKIVSCFEGDELDTKEYVVSRDSLDQLMTAYFSAPTDHSQLVQFSDTKIKCQDTDCVPTINQTYLQFKNIKLSDCRFVYKYKATPRLISNWLGQDISILEKEEDPNSFLFQVHCKDGTLSRKRKYSELLEDNGQSD